MSNQRKDFDITNDMFQESTPITTKIMLEDMPSNDELNHVFSKGCERKMKKRKIVLITLLLIGVLLLGSILYNLFLGKTANILMLTESLLNLSIYFSISLGSILYNLFLGKTANI